MVAMKKVFSSHVSEIGYDSQLMELHVLYQNGKRSVYSDVSPSKGQAVVNAPSVGSALHREIKGLFPHRYA